MKSKWAFTAGLSLLVLMGCLIAGAVFGPVETAKTVVAALPVEDKPVGRVAAAMEDPQADPIVGISNPAAVYCSGLGYQYEVKTDPQTGQETGVCILPDNSACDEWAFLAGNCGQGYSYCARNGYQTKVKKDGRDPFSEEYAECVDKAGKVVGSVSGLFQLDEKIKQSGCSNELPIPMPEQAANVQAPAPVGSSLEKIGINPENSSIARSDPVLAATLPASFDWRSVAGANWMTPVKNQAGCGSCWAFAAVGVVEAAYNIANNNSNLDLDLSEQYLVSDCSGAGTCCGGSSYGSLDYIRTTGIPDEGCLPYADSSCGCGSQGCSTTCTYHTGSQCSNRTCGDRCANYASRLVRIDENDSIDSNADAMKRAIVERGPIVIYVLMGGSFDANKVYRCDPDGPINHAVVAVGYNDAGGYWIVRNSWGAGWNGDGHFKVGYGECSAEVYPQYASLHPLNPPVINSLSPATIEAGSSVFSLTVNGANFTPGSVVRWNGRGLETTYHSNQQLRVQIPAADVVTTGTAKISVNTLPPGGGTSNEVAFYITSSTTYFSKQSPETGTTGLFPEVSVAWDSLSGAAEYQYCYDKVGNGSCSDWRSSGTNTTALLSGLDPNTKYYWQVRASRQGATIYANGSSTAYWNFTTIPPSYRVLINEVHSYSPVHVELYNGTGGAVNLSGWKLQTYNSSGSSQTYTFGSFSLPAGGYVTLREGSGTDTATNRYLKYDIEWYGSSGAVSLVNNQGSGIDYLAFNYTSALPTQGTYWSGPNPAYPHSGSVLGRIGMGIDTDGGEDWCIQAPSAGSRNGSCKIPEGFDKYLIENGAADVPIQGYLWANESSGASRYLFCVDTVDDDTCNTGWVDQGYRNYRYYYNLSEGVTYYWQARARNGIHQVEANGGDWWHFTPMAYLPDGYEFDDDAGHAKTIPSGGPQTHSIVPETDTDWVTFTLPARSKVVLETTGTYYADTRMWLYDSNMNEVEYNDDGGAYLYSYIDRTCQDNPLPAGTYYVKVDEFGNDNSITAYHLSLTARTCSYNYLPSINK